MYREVTDIDRLIATEDVPVLVVFMDGRTLSDQAIAFTESLCDQFSKTARIVRVNVKLGDNTEEIDRLVKPLQSIRLSLVRRLLQRPAQIRRLRLFGGA